MKEMKRMTDECKLSFQHRSLMQQGYEQFTEQQLTEMEWGLRFTPFVCALIALYGLVTQQPWVLFSVAGLGIWAFLFPAAHPMDRLYNHVVRPLFAAASIPPNPLQRRLACLSAAIMNVAAGTLFLLGWPVAAYAVGGCLLVLQAIVIATHFCALSWMYEGVARMLGKWNLPVDPELARRLLKDGARVIDVRTPQEFAVRHLDCAVNHPLENLRNELEKLPEGTLLLHCKSGMRSNMATQLLKKNGFKNVHNLGSFDRAKSIVDAA
jgi:rhodanese-related sulfurtransferase